MLSLAPRTSGVHYGMRDVRYPTVTPNLIAESVQLGAKARLSP